VVSVVKSSRGDRGSVKAVAGTPTLNEREPKNSLVLVSQDPAKLEAVASLARQGKLLPRQSGMTPTALPQISMLHSAPKLSLEAWVALAPSVMRVSVANAIACYQQAQLL
jgi:hypothetical protein